MFRRRRPEPESAGAGEHAVFGVAELAGQLRHGQVGAGEQPVGQLATGAVGNCRSLAPVRGDVPGCQLFVLKCQDFTG
ncbi:Uncharacterised protein [Mycobacteroides abscessus]|nr:Uncharacterised protein [Mycobacteroides abscessus]